jgi:tight adherence protein B
MTLLAVLAGFGFGAGVWLVVDGLRPPDPAAFVPLRRERPSIDLRRLCFGIVAGLVLLALTRWPVAFAAGFAAGWFAPDLVGAKAAQQQAIARTEALASWTEMLRDTLAGAHGLEEAIVTSAAVAPEPIHPEVTALAERLRRQPIDEALDDFGRDLVHPIGDLVVTALRLAAGGSSGDLNELLGTLAVSARDEAAMRLRVEATRARLRTAVRVITLCTASTALGLVVLNRAYLQSYESAVGQVILAIVLAAWGVALWWLARMGDYVAPERFLASDGRKGG